MDVVTGIAAFALGGAVGALLAIQHYTAYLKLEHDMRKLNEQDLDAERAYADKLNECLHQRETALARLEQQKACESSWCDGYEAGLREGMQGKTVGDVIAWTHLNCARGSTR